MARRTRAFVFALLAGATSACQDALDLSAPAVLVGTASGATSEAGGQATFTLALASRPTGNVEIALDTSDPGEGQPLESSILFLTEDWDQPRTVAVEGLDDFVDDGDASFTVQVTVASADERYAALDPDDVSVVNTDDETAGISVTGIDETTSELGGVAIVTVALDSEPLADVTLVLEISDATEGIVLGGSLVTFTVATWATAQTIVVQGLPDGVSDGDQPFSLVLLPSQSADPLYDGLDLPDPSLVNGDVPPVDIGYYDMSTGAGNANQIAPITRIGMNAVDITNPDGGGLAGIDILFAQNPDNGAYGAEYLNKLNSIEQAVDAGMTLVIHDRFVTDAATILPGGSAIAFTRDSTGDRIDLLDTAPELVGLGLAGTIDDDSLDGGTSSFHGWASLSTLPAGSIPILSTDVPDRIVTFSYPFGNGRVTWSGIPLDYYLSGSGPAVVNTNMRIYVSNLLGHEVDSLP